MDSFDFNTFSNDLDAAWKYAKSYPYKCCYPGCNEKAIKSHLLQQHPVLESICDENNCLLQMADNKMDPRSLNWNLYNRHKVGISIALQYKLFCSCHDSGLFKDIENQNSIPKTKRDCLLMAFRSACAVRHQEEYRLHVYEKEAQRIGQRHLMEDNSRIYICRMSSVIDNLWKAINGDGDHHYLFRMIAMPRTDIAVSDCITDEKDFVEHVLDDNYIEPLNCLFINLIPTEKQLLLLLGCDTRYDKQKEFWRIIEDFPTGNVGQDVYLDTLKGILLKCSNWCCSPGLYDNSDWTEFFDKFEGLKLRSSILA
mgnify:CR=1 FL=1